LIGSDPKEPMIYNDDIITFLLQNLGVCNSENNEVYHKDIKIVKEFIQKTQINSIIKRKGYDISRNKLFDENAYNFCLKCLQFQCVQHCEPG